MNVPPKATDAELLGRFRSSADELIQSLLRTRGSAD